MADHFRATGYMMMKWTKSLITTAMQRCLSVLQVLRT